MKHNLLYLTALLFLFGTACVKSDYVAPITPSTGTYKGVFGYLHRANSSAAYDTLKASVTLTLNGGDNTFQVSGDTTTLHAGSYGSYNLNASYIAFTDKTNPATGVPVKKHLNGTYLYSYDGVTLKMLFNIGDTVSMQYQLIKN